MFYPTRGTHLLSANQTDQKFAIRLVSTEILSIILMDKMTLAQSLGQEYSNM